MTKKKIVFFGRHNNDIDWMVPLIDKVSEDQSYEIYYLLLSPDLEVGDFRIEYIKKKNNVRVLNILDLADDKIIVKSIRRLRRSCRNVKLFKKMIDSLTVNTIGHYDFDGSIKKFLDILSPDLLVLDRVSPGKRKKKKYPPYGISEVFNWAKENQKKLISVPHGLLLFNLKTQYSRFGEVFDVLVSTSEVETEKFLHDGVVKEKILKAGSSRYDLEWLEKLGEILPNIKYDTDNKYVITFFATKMVYEYDFERLLMFLEEISEIKDVLLIVQPHPRGQKAKDFNRISSRKNIIIDTETPASVLIRNSHAVSTLVSSVIVEAICMEKPLVYPKYLHKEETAFEKAGAAIVIEDEKDATKTIRKVIEGSENVPKDNYERFLERYVYTDSRYPNTMIKDFFDKNL